MTLTEIVKKHPAVTCLIAGIIYSVQFWSDHTFIFAIPGLALGCLLFNITFAGALPLDFLVGSLASGLAAAAMWLTRRVTVKGFPLLGLLLPAITNAVLVGWELSVYIGGVFWLNAVCVAVGELIALLIPGMLLWSLLNRKDLGNRLFSSV